MRPTLEVDPSGCGFNKPCPKLWALDGRLFWQGRPASPDVVALLNVPDDELVVEWPPETETALLDWAARRLADRGR
jgi:hypothetical protein